MKNLLYATALNISLAISNNSVCIAQENTANKIFQGLDCKNPPKESIENTKIYKEIYEIYKELKEASNLQAQISFILKWDCALDAWYRPGSNLIGFHIGLITQMGVNKDEIRSIIAHELGHAYGKENKTVSVRDELAADIYSHKLLSKLGYKGKGIISFRQKENEYYRNTKYPSSPFFIKWIMMSPDDYDKSGNKRINGIKKGL